MGYLDSLKESFIGYVSFPLSSYLMNRRGIIKKFSKLKKSEWFAEDRLKEIQLEKLKKLLEYANTWVPYYTKTFKEAGFSPKDIKQLDDIKMLPILSRQDVIDHHKEMVDIRYQASVKIADDSKKGPGEPIAFARFLKNNLIKNTSSGSTGAPTVFYEDGSVTALNWANELRMRSWYGIGPGAKEARMARISNEYMPKSKVLLRRRYLWNQQILPGINLSDEDYEFCCQSIEDFKPKVFWGFTSALYGLAQYIEKNRKNLLTHRPELVITWAAPLYEHEKQLLTSVFACPVTNIYGTREVGHIAGICPNGSFHINQESLFVETEDNAEGFKEKGIGEILVTNLEITPMPFIRYRMGDIGKIASSDCSCGRSLQVIKNFLGRTGEVFITQDGRMIAPNFWCRTFMDKTLANAIKRFQVIYKKNSTVLIKIVRNEAFSQNMEMLLREKMDRNFHSNKVEFEYVSKIDPQISGKYQMVINENSGASNGG